MSNAAKIAELRAEADRLEAADREFNRLPEDQKLAISLHQLLCRHNHLDGCGWEYEINNIRGEKYEADWDGHAHGRYLAKARFVLQFCKANNISTNAAVGLIETVHQS